MNNSQTLSTSWPHRSDVVVLVNPAKRKRVMAGALVIAAVAFFLLSGEAERLINKQSNDARREAIATNMRTLASAGKPAAMLWLAKNYANEEYRLDDLVKMGNAEAMYILGHKKLKRGDHAGGMQLIQGAAAEGYPDAVLEKAAK